VIEIEAQAPPDLAVRLIDVLEFACAELAIPRASLGLMVVGPREMAEINGAHRATPAPTDVLSFPVDGPDLIDGWPEDGPAPELGDIIICPEAAQEPVETLAVHGLLHLLGYDHETDAGEMLDLQDDLMDRYAAREAV
jgi:probable rRNA maturation factor